MSASREARIEHWAAVLVWDWLRATGALRRAMLGLEAALAVSRYCLFKLFRSLCFVDAAASRYCLFKL